MKKIIAGCVAAIVPVTSIAASVSLDTAGRCYEATRQSTQMAMLLDPNAAEYKNLNSNAKELFGTLSGGVGEKDSKKIREMNRYPQDVIMQEANKCVRLAIKAGLVKL